MVRMSPTNKLSHLRSTASGSVSEVDMKMVGKMWSNCLMLRASSWV